MRCGPGTRTRGNSTGSVLGVPRTFELEPGPSVPSSAFRHRRHSAALPRAQGALHVSASGSHRTRPARRARRFPADAYYGVQTARALENFHISGVELHLYPDLISALAMVKLAAARANFDCGQFEPGDPRRDRGAPARSSSTGKLHDQFRLDVFQGGAGTSTNMNANEVIANRALELMGHAEGRVPALRPARSRERSQSTNDAYPTALHVGDDARQRPAGRGDERADRRLPGEGHGVRRRPQDGPHAAAGRRADDARPGVRRLRRDARRRGPRAERDRARAVRDQHGRHGDRHGPQRARRLRREVHEAPRDDHRAADPPRRRTSSRRRRTRRRSSSTRRA